jgi:hypothetical protein
MQQCTSCGAPFPSESNNCPACGTPVYEAGPFQETASAAPGAQTDRTKFAAPYRPGTFQEVSPVQPAPPATAPPSYFSGYTHPQGSTHPMYPSLQQPPLRPRSSLSRGMIIAIVLAALLIMFSGFGLIYYSTVYHPAQLRIQATSTAQTLQTQAARATALANAQTTGTAVAYANATSTAQAVATTNAQATATALQNVYTTDTRGTPSLNDSLAFNTGSGWDEDLAQGGGGCAFSNGAYHASLDPKGYYFPCIAQNTNFSDFVFQVQMSIIRGDGGGLVFRANSSVFKFYVLDIGHDGTYYIEASKDQTHSTEIGYGQSSAFKQNRGQSNLLTLIARGNNMYVYINKQYTGSVSDSTFTSGQIGFMVDSHSTSTEVAFTNARVWKI